jgi:CheY-like chemotaxis protein
MKFTPPSIAACNARIDSSSSTSPQNPPIAMAMEWRPSVVVCDAAVPGMTGLELYRELSAREGERATRFVFIASEKVALVNAAAMAGVPTLVKPFTASDLEAALAEAGVAAPRVG